MNVRLGHHLRHVVLYQELPVHLLDRIDGIGPVRRRKLLAKFGSISQILRADELEISKTAGVSMEFAGKVKEQLRMLKGKAKKRITGG